MTGDAQPYQYLVEVDPQVPRARRASAGDDDATAGFKRVTHTAFSGNIAALHSRLEAC